MSINGERDAPGPAASDEVRDFYEKLPYPPPLATWMNTASCPPIRSAAGRCSIGYGRPSSREQAKRS